MTFPSQSQVFFFNLLLLWINTQILAEETTPVKFEDLEMETPDTKNCPPKFRLKKRAKAEEQTPSPIRDFGKPTTDEEYKYKRQWHSVTDNIRMHADLRRERVRVEALEAQLPLKTNQVNVLQERGK